MIIIFSKKLKYKRLLIVGVLLLCFFLRRGFTHDAKMTLADGNEQKYYVAIIIDDFGYHGEGTDEMLNIDIPFTAAVMPFSENSAQDAQAVHDAGKEIILHMPMESLTGKKSWVGDKGIFKSMSDDEIKQRVNEALGVVKYATGLNNHMGSAIMEDERSLGAVMDIVSENGLIFVDSMTTEKSVGDDVCNAKGVQVIKRDVFLDSTDDINVVKKNLQKTENIALKKGFAVAIGHVGPEGGNITAKAIAEMSSQMKEKGIEFVTVSKLSNVIKTGQIQTKKIAE